ncbi:hypothetical protein R3P38DRAFT_3289497 [Favolaschia claudopus]|uniref:Uncharacterized protein n=1 Tax=Favolaschia claudopus TaxID=2862362 RepID=A0AAV9ZVT1_9AGAR
MEASALITTPRLWIGLVSVRISWRIRVGSESKQQIRVEGLKAWFARSAALPVDVRLLDIEGGMSSTTTFTNPPARRRQVVVQTADTMHVRSTVKFRPAMEDLQRRSLNIELRDSPG